MTYARADIRPVLGSLAEIEEWAAFRKSGGKTGAAVHVDTGMNRLGLTLHDALNLRRNTQAARRAGARPHHLAPCLCRHARTTR